MARIVSKRFFLFLLVGGSATVLQFVLLVMFVEVLGMVKVAASAVAYLLSAIYNYLLNYHLTFKSQRAHWETAPKFAGVVMIGVSVNTGVFSSVLPFTPYIAAQCLAILVALVSNYLLHKYWVYKEE